MLLLVDFGVQLVDFVDVLVDRFDGGGEVGGDRIVLGVDGYESQFQRFDDLCGEAGQRLVGCFSAELWVSTSQNVSFQLKKIINNQMFTVVFN